MNVYICIYIYICTCVIYDLYKAYSNCSVGLSTCRPRNQPQAALANYTTLARSMQPVLKVETLQARWSPVNERCLLKSNN